MGKRKQIIQNIQETASFNVLFITSAPVVFVIVHLGFNTVAATVGYYGNVQGRGEPLLLLHGMTCNYNNCVDDANVSGTEERAKFTYFSIRDFI